MCLRRGFPFQKVAKPSGKRFRKFVNHYTTWRGELPDDWMKKGDFHIVSMFVYFLYQQRRNLTVLFVCVVCDEK